MSGRAARAGLWAGLGLVSCVSVGPGVADAPVAGADRLAFARLYHIEAIDPDGRNRRRVSQRSGNYWALAWAPASRR